jgi:hypothetical protein
MIVSSKFSATKLRLPRDGINPPEVEIYSCLHTIILLHDTLKCDVAFSADGSTYDIRNLSVDTIIISFICVIAANTVVEL